MARPNYLEQIRHRVNAAEVGSVFIPSDFFDIAEAAKINTCLNRLVKSGDLNHPMRGVFAKPQYSQMLHTHVPPNSNEIAKAIARNYGWTIIPCGDTVLNMLGLSTQAPTVWLYVSDGPYKSYKVDGVLLKFKHTDSKNEIVEVSYQTALIIQALKALGKDNITSNDIRILSKKLSLDEKREALVESKRITAWVYEYVKQICVEENNETSC